MALQAHIELTTSIFIGGENGSLANPLPYVNFVNFQMPPSSACASGAAGR
jgi:hypothetical protein